ncbi:hypothetical protein RHGRI_008424 [Rhododendron griersonianum]|uniref:fructokinase n=1 Tax=Rhododendron griersonianum TaxID=479676 RepID=A0AAV6L1Y9_9ERIC|nr:hypothetical protein RHGRI_008424 [Rhododendron griersonianum]
MLIDFVPTVSGVSLAEAPAFKKAPGGAPANVAVGIARLGGSSAFIGKVHDYLIFFIFLELLVGEDEFGYLLTDILKQNNVDNSGVRFDPSARTALAFVTLRADGEREFLFFRHPSADMLLHESELDRNLIKQARIFHYGSISLIEEPCRSTHIAAMAAAKESGCILSYDPNLRLPLWPSADAAREGIMSIWDQADVIKISEDEISFLTGGDDPYDDNVVMEKLFHPNLKLLLVTEGSDGCRYYTKQFKGKVPGVKVKAVDTTGAGDAFVGGILNSLASDFYLHEILLPRSILESLFDGLTMFPKVHNFAILSVVLDVINRGTIEEMATNNTWLLPEIGPDGLPREAPIIAYTEKTWEAASKAVKDEEAIKEKLCKDLNNLVQESSNTQLARMEELKRRLEALNPSRSSISVSYDGKPVGPIENSLALDASSVPPSLAPGGTENIANHVNAGNAPGANDLNQQPSAEGEGKGKKKIMIQGRGKGLGAVPKGRVPPTTGWTGAGFDVDGRT